MTDEWGIDHRYEDALGVEREVPSATIATLRELIGRPEDEDGSLQLRFGTRAAVGPAVLILEDGSEENIEDRLPPDVPIGYHTLRADDGGRERLLIVSPARCHREPGLRAWGLAAQLYAARSRASWGIGDLGDLRRLARWSREELGAGFVLVNPLGAVAPSRPEQASPYFPASRRFRNPLYLRVEDIPGAASAGASVAALAAAGRALDGERTIDRAAIWRLKRAALEAVWTQARADAGFEAWLREQDESLGDFAVWCTLVEAHGPHWQSWPEGLRRPRTPDVVRFGREHDDRVRFHAWLQWLTAMQLERAGAELSIVQDLPIGIDPGGMDAWSWQDELALQATVGAPPDEFNRRGQDWGLPPFIPWRLRAAGYRPFIETIRAILAGAAGLRIDHVMGLFRLWWIPPGAEPKDGAFVRYPAEALLDVLAIESHRARATIVGEDLGTVEESARRMLADRGVLSYRLLWFETDAPSLWPADSLAAVTTHDLPTVRGLWEGSDLESQRRLALNPNETATAAIRDRLRSAGGLATDAPAEEAILAAHRLLAAAPSALVAMTLDDAVGEAERPNMPGADAERPNWSIALAAPLEEIETAPLPKKLAAILREGRAAASHQRKQDHER